MTLFMELLPSPMQRAEPRVSTGHNAQQQTGDLWRDLQPGAACRQEGGGVPTARAGETVVWVERRDTVMIYGVSLRPQTAELRAGGAIDDGTCAILRELWIFAADDNASRLVICWSKPGARSFTVINTSVQTCGKFSKVSAVVMKF